MIVTVTPNPSIDRTIRVDHLERGGLNRASSTTSEAAGKGLNVSRALRLHGFETLAILPLAMESAATYLLLLGEAVPIRTVPVAGTVRTNISLVEPDGWVTKVNEPGPEMGETDVEALLAAAAATGADWIVGCGSLPPAAPADFYARLADLASASRRIAVDTSGPAFQACTCSGVDLLKPNLSELEDFAGRRLMTLGAVVAAACDVIECGTRSVLVSLGPDGAVYVDRNGAIHAEARVDDAANPVGAGDALLAGYLAYGGGPTALAPAVAWSVAAVRSVDTRMHKVTPADMEAVVVHPELEAHRVLRR